MDDRNIGSGHGIIRATLIALATLLVVPLVAAPRAQFDYFLTGNGNDAAGATTFGLGLMGAAPTWMRSSRG
jgi:hypothetical protein